MASSARLLVLLVAAVLLSRCAGCGAEEEFSCPSGQVQCHGICTDPATYQTDAANCGACGISCGPGACSGGVCDCTGFESCGATANPRCADTRNDPHNCGTCGYVCRVANETCSGGTCQCLAPFSACNDGALCTNLQTDPRNCGDCGTTCELTGAICVNAVCACPDGDIQCPSGTPTRCVDPATDALNCGDCDVPCPAGHVCSARQCGCPTGTTECNGACVDLATDEQNCGACANRCATGATCTNRRCAACPTGPALGCGDTCCGGGSACCGTACPQQHSNGVGGSYFDCATFGTYDVIQAEKAAKGWDPAASPSTFLLQCPSQYCRAWQNGAACATWCYGPQGDTLRGRAVLVPSLVCQCPQPGTPNWN